MRDITEAGVREITRRINTGEISASETAAAFVEKAAAHSELNAFVRLVNKPATPVDGGNLFGVPIAHKDIFCERGVLSTCASRILENFVSPYDAAVVEKTRAAAWYPSDAPIWMSLPWALPGSIRLMALPRESLGLIQSAGR